MKNVSGDVIVGKHVAIHNEPLFFHHSQKKNTITLGLCFADGSNGHLMVSTHSGDIDAYVGDSGSAELHSQEGKWI